MSSGKLRNSRYMKHVLLALLAFTLAPLAEAQLADRLRAIAAEAHGKVGVACSLPGTSLDCEVNAAARLPMQSVYKLPIAMAVLSAVEQGRFHLSREIPFRTTDLISPGQHSPLRDQHPNAGVDVPLETLLRLAVSESDGIASDILLRTLGGPSVTDAYIKHLGITGIRIADTEKTLGVHVSAQYRNYAEARSLVALLRRLADHSPLNAEHTRMLLGWMTQTETGQHRIRALLPAGTIVAHKTGTSGTDGGITHATNDIGLITMEDRRTLAVAVLVSDSPEPEQVRESVIARISLEIWKAASAHL